MSSKTTRIALIGYGLGGAVFHAPLIAATPGLDLTAVVTSDQTRQLAVKRTYPNARIYATTDELWRDCADYDCAVIASPNKYHAPLAMAAMEHKLAVVVDKPMAVSQNECLAMIEKSASTKQLLTVFQNRRWDSDFLTVKNLIKENALGKITRFESRFERWRPQPKAGSWRELGEENDAAGILFDLGSHLVDQAILLFGRPVRVYSEAFARRPGVKTNDDAFVALTFEDNVVAHLWMSAVACKQAPRFLVRGVNGTYEKYGLDPQEDLLRAGSVPHAKWGVESKNIWGNLSTDSGAGVVSKTVESEAGDYPAFYAAWRDALRGDGPVPVDPRDGLLAVQILTGAYAG